MEVMPLALLVPILLAVGYCDLRYMRIPNALPLAALALFMVSAPLFLSLDSILWRTILASACLAASFIGFAFGLFGGGDAKMMPVFLLFVPPQAYPYFGIVFAAGLYFGLALVFISRKFRLAPECWAFMSAGRKIPFGVPIAMTGILQLATIFTLS